MKKKRFSWFVILAALAAAVLIFILTPTEDPRVAVENSVDLTAFLERLALPANSGELVVHNGFTLLYSEEHEQPVWVAYVLTPAETITKVTDRQDNFRSDPAISTGSSTPADYKGSGYDRGHMAPFADLSWSEEAASDSFYMSNMSPQSPALNRGRWQDLESIVRTFSLSGPVCVVTGPVLTDGPYRTIGENRVSVPNFYFKAVLYYNGDNSRSIAFVLPNESCPESVSFYAVPVDYVEHITGLDLFPLLDDDPESRIEASFNVSDWDFSPYSAKIALSYGFDPDNPDQDSLSVVPAVSYKEPETFAEFFCYYLHLYFSEPKRSLQNFLHELRIFRFS